MPAKKVKKDPTMTNATTAETQSGDRRPMPAGGIATEDLTVLEGDIDSRMKALLKDHQDMGARPK